MKAVQTETEPAVNAMNQGATNVGRGTQVIDVTGKRFKNIVNLVQNFDGHVQEISVASGKLSVSSTTVVNAVGGVKTKAADTAINTETISAATEEQFASMEEIVEASQTLAHMADNLQNAVNIFKL